MARLLRVSAVGIEAGAREFWLYSAVLGTAVVAIICIVGGGVLNLDVGC
jgi:hypothetical protein